MKIADIIAGNVYKSKGTNKLGVCDKPKKCKGSESGYVVGLTPSCGNRIMFTKDGSLISASMREQRDFWRNAYHDMIGEVCL